MTHSQDLELIQVVDDSALLSLAHAKNYDPRKAHEYYLRTRHLRGRKSASPQATGSSVKPSSNVQTLQKRTHAQNEAQLEALLGRLADLRALLKKRVEEAQAKSGVKDNSQEKQHKKDITDHLDKTSPADKQKAAKGSSPRSTVQQRREDAKRARENYKKKHKTPAQSEPSVKAQIEEVQAKIKEIESRLRDVVAQARRDASAKSKSKTASKGR